MAYAQARVWYKSVFRAIVDWKEDASAHLAPVANTQAQEAVVRHSVAQRRRHEIWTWRQAWLCRTCGETFHPDSHPRQWGKAECRGSMRSRLLHSMGVQLPSDERDCDVAEELTRQGEARWAERNEGQQPRAEARLSHTKGVRRRLVGGSNLTLAPCQFAVAQLWRWRRSRRTSPATSLRRPEVSPSAVDAVVGPLTVSVRASCADGRGAWTRPLVHAECAGIDYVQDATL